VTFRQLQSFSEVARLRSVTGAANALGVSEPAVSLAVGALRRELGDDLFVRGAHGLVLTPGGERLAEAAAEILALAQLARDDVARLH
jgi:LysR family transcriptional regulator, low CO2-responsive transcriptional regulator